MIVTHDDRVRALVFAIYELLVEGSVHPPGFQEAKYRKTPTYINAEAGAAIVIRSMTDGLGHSAPQLTAR